MSEPIPPSEPTPQGPEQNQNPVRQTSDTFLARVRKNLLSMSTVDKISYGLGFGTEGAAVLSIFQGNAGDAIQRGFIGALLLALSWNTQRSRNRRENSEP